MTMLSAARRSSSWPCDCTRRASRSSSSMFNRSIAVKARRGHALLQSLCMAVVHPSRMGLVPQDSQFRGRAQEHRANDRSRSRSRERERERDKRERGGGYHHRRERWDVERDRRGGYYTGGTPSAGYLERCVCVWPCATPGTVTNLLLVDVSRGKMQRLTSGLPLQKRLRGISECYYRPRLRIFWS
jgi:hypothetical protein